MIYVPGLVTGQLSGKAGSTTARANPFAASIGVSKNTSSRSSPSNTAVRSSFATLQRLYASLSSGDLASWVALGGLMRVGGRLGRSYSLTGPAAFLSVNRNRFSIGQAPLSTAPAIVIPAAFSFGSFVAVGPTPGPESITFTTLPTPVPADTAVLVYGQVIRSSSILSPPRKSWVIVAQLAAAAGGTHNITAAYVSRCGQVVAGQRIWLKIIPLSLEGFKGAGAIASAIVS